MIKFVIFLSLVVFASGHTESISESSKQKRSIFEDVRIVSPVSSYGHGYPWTRSKNLLKVLKIPSELSLLPTRSIVSYGSAVRPPSPLVVTKHIIVEKQIPVPGKPVIYEKQVPIHVPVHVPVKVPVPQLLPYPVERQVPVHQNVPYPVPIIITTQIAQAPQPTSQPQTLQLAPQPASPAQTFQLAPQPTSPTQTFQIASQPSPPPQVLQLAPAPQQSLPPQVLQLAPAPQQNPPPQLFQLAQAPQQNPPPQLLQLAQAPQQNPQPQLLQLASAPQDNPAPQIFQLAQAPQPTLATPTFSQHQSSLARQPSNSRPSILPISFSVNAGISAGVKSAPQHLDYQNIDFSSLGRLNLFQAPPSPQPFQSNDLGSHESSWAPEEYSDLYSK